MKQRILGATFVVALIAAVVILAVGLANESARNERLTNELSSAEEQIGIANAKYVEQVQIAGQASMEYAELREFVAAQTYTTVRDGEFGCGLGRFEYPSYEKDLLVVAAAIDGLPDGTASYCAGTVTPTTDIRVIGAQGVNRANLSLLTGRKVFARGTFRDIGEGEGSRTFIKTMEIIVLPDDPR